MISLETFRREPYRFLFVIGFFHLIWGLSIWGLFVIGATSYPGVEHARFMVQGFLLSFSMGFLMTAVPRFSQSSPPTWSESVSAGILAILSGLFDIAALGAMLFLVAFGARRLLFRKKKVPPFFIFIQGGLSLGVAGLAIKVFTPSHFYAFKGWLYEGMMLMWLCGIGSRILVMLLSPGGNPLSALQNRLIFLLLFGGIFIQPFHPILARFGDLMRFIAIAYLSIRVWRIHAIPRGRGAMAWGVWMGISLMNLGQGMKVASPALNIHSVHLIFIGGFCTLALMVAIRVSIAHSGDSLEYERSYSRIKVIAILLAFAAFTRFSAGILRPELYFNHLAYAALTALVSVPLWVGIVFPRLIRDADTELLHQNIKEAGHGPSPQVQK